MWPWEVLNVACLEQFGFALDDIETIDATVSMPSSEPEFGFSIRTSNPFDIATIADSVATGIEVSPKDESLRFRGLYELPMLRIAQKDPNRVLVGTQGTLRRMMSQRIKTGGKIVELVSSRQSDVRVAVNLVQIRDLLLGLWMTQEQQVPEMFRGDIENVIELTDNLLVELEASDSNPIRVSFGTDSRESTEKLEESLQRLRTEGLQFARESVESQLASEPSISDAMKQAASKYADRVQETFSDTSMWSIEEDRLELKTETSMMASYQTIGVMTGLLLPAVQAARDAARRMSSSNNMKQIMLAIYNFESAYRKFPERVTRDKAGAPLLSWRVAILPYIEQNNLYQQFHLDEPWDSPHNITLLERMPQTYANPQVEVAPGYTVYLAPVGKNAGWLDKNMRLSAITDGTSNTIALTEVAPHLAVPWTAPDDLDIDENPGTSWMSDRGANVGMFDGSVRWLPAQLAEDVLRALMTINGGEVIPMLP
jgi:prepilin-type processing-associated H-X9-DG protein